MSEKGQPELEAQPPLASWVRTLNLDEGAAAALDAAIPGMTLDEFEADADAWLPQEDPSYRKLLIKLLWDHFLAKDDDGRLVNSAFLQLFKYGPPQVRHDLFYVRYGLSQPWTLLAARKLVAPARAKAEEDPDAKGAGVLGTADWDTFVDEHIEQDRGPSSRKKTRGTVAGVLVQLGSLERVGRKLVATRGKPHPMAFAWTVYWEMAARGEETWSIEEAATESAAAYVFAPTPEEAMDALEGAAAKGLFTRFEDGPDLYLRPVLNADWSKLKAEDRPTGWASPVWVPEEGEAASP